MLDRTIARPRGPLAMATATALLLTLAACGGTGQSTGSTGSTGSTSNDVRGARDNLARYLEPRAPTAAGKPFAAAAATGKVVEVIDLTGANPAVAAVSTSVRSALDTQGVTVQRCDAGGVSVKIGSCIDQGVSQKVQAVVVIGGDPKTYSQGAASAKSAGIPLISALDFPMPSEVQAAGVDASGLAEDVSLVSGNAAPPDALSGTLAADFIVADAKGKAKILFISSPGIVGSEYVEKAFSVELKKRCPACTVISAGVSLPNWASGLAPVVSAKLAQNPDIGYVVPVFDPMAAYTNPAINQAGKSSVKVVTVNGSLQQMQELANGGLVTAEVGQNFPEMGLIAADQALRFLAGVPTVPKAAASARVFTRDNIKSVTVADANFRTGEWYTGSPGALRQFYSSLWSG